MTWYNEAVFYHIYPLGLTGAPALNPGGEPVHRLPALIPWLDHMQKMHMNALYIGPLFESVGHGYETTDYRTLDRRLGDNGDLKEFVRQAHARGIRVIFDAVFNHTGREFFAFKDLKEKRENSSYRDWYCNVNFWNNNEYNDGFSYDNWGGYNLLAKLNLRNGAVRDYLLDTVRFWVSEFDVDGLRLDAADVLDFDFMKDLRALAGTVKPDFYLMGEVIHGEYTRWVNPQMLHAVTNYALHKALYSGCNDHNFFEIAHTVQRLYGMGGGRPEGLRLYNFTDNHDVERIMTKLVNKAHYTPVHILEYTLPGVPSVYYGSEFGIEGKKERGSDASLRPHLELSDYADALEKNSCTKLIAALGQIRISFDHVISDGAYTQLMLTNRQYAFARTLDGEQVIVTVNNDDGEASFDLPAQGRYIGGLSGRRVQAQDGRLRVTVPGNGGEIWVPDDGRLEETAEWKPVEKIQIRAGAAAGSQNTPAETGALPQMPGSEHAAAAAAPVTDSPAEDNTEPGAWKAPVHNDGTELSYEEMSVAQLQQAILYQMSLNGPVTPQMKKTVTDNIWHDSLVSWVKSFRH